MINRRRQGQVRTDNYTRPEIVEAREMQSATKEPVSYEHVFYTGHARSRLVGKEVERIGAGTNKYEFEFPPEWRTKNGKACIFGVRALYLIKCTRVLAFNFKLTYNKVLEFDMDYYIEYLADDHLGDLLYALNADLKCMLVLTLLPHARQQFQWTWDPDHQWILIVSPSWDDVKLEYKAYDGSKAFFTFGSAGEGMGPTISFWSRENLLVTADFVRQTNTQHLGYADCEYSNIKKYEIIRNDPYFTLSLWDSATMRPIELPADGKDYLVMEALIYNDYEVLAPTK
jgi:hypothetical protein